MKFLLCMFLISSCGTDLSELAEEKSQLPDSTETSSQPTPTVAVEVEVRVDVNTVTQPVIHSRDLPYLYFAPHQVTWAEALGGSPEGYALVTRVEAIQLIESGEIYDYLNEDDIFWTASDRNHDFAWLIDLTREDAWPLLKTSKFPALYIQIVDGE